jgi:hypothetical protein
MRTVIPLDWLELKAIVMQRLGIDLGGACPCGVRGALQVRLTPDFDYSRALFGVSEKTSQHKQLSGVIPRPIMMVGTSITETATKANYMRRAQ